MAAEYIVELSHSSLDGQKVKEGDEGAGIPESCLKGLTLTGHTS